MTQVLDAFDRWLVRHGYPLRYIDCTWEDYEETVGDRAGALNAMRELCTVENALEILQEGRGVYIAGPVGTGKSLALTIIAREVARVLRTQNFTTTPPKFMLASELGDWVHVRPNDASYQTRTDFFNTPLLALDDLCRLGGSTRGDHERGFLDRLLRHRYHQRLPTMFSSQHPLDAKNIVSVLGAGIVDLIRGFCGDDGVFILRGRSHRGRRDAL